MEKEHKNPLEPGSFSWGIWMMLLILGLLIVFVSPLIMWQISQRTAQAASEIKGILKWELISLIFVVVGCQRIIRWIGKYPRFAISLFFLCAVSLFLGLVRIDDQSLEALADYQKLKQERCYEPEKVDKTPKVFAKAEA